MIVLGLLLALAAPLSPQAEPEYLVEGKAETPPWWIVSDGEREVRIMGLPGAVAGDRLDFGDFFVGRVREADVVILPAPIDLAPFRDLRQLAYGSAGLRLGTGGRAADPRLVPLLRSTSERELFARLRGGLGPMWLAERASGRIGVSPVPWTDLFGSVQRWFAARGRSFAAKIVRPHGITAEEALRTVSAMPDAAAADCQKGVLEEIDSGPDALARASSEWLAGALPDPFIRPRSRARCLAMTLAGQALIDRTTANTATMITQALALRDTRSVAFVELPLLLGETGVLHRLRAQGVTVRQAGGQATAP